MKSLNIASNLKLPLELAQQAICTVGIRGSGKTNTGRVMAEELLDAGVPICVIDPTDAWWGLRASRDGKGEGYPVFIFGGEHGDLPLEETHGKTIAEFLVGERVPVVLSLRHLRKGAQRRFVTDLAEELYHLKGKAENRSPLTVFIDEAPLFVPQQTTGDIARTVGAVEDLVNRGRNAGFGVVLISQRFATINKNVTTQAGVIIAHRLTSPQDRKALSEWIEENATIEQQRDTLASLATLKNGEAWVWAPVLDAYARVQMRLSSTFDSGATPKMGAKPIEPRKLAEIDREKLRARMSAAVEAKKANDPAELKKKLAELEKQLKALSDANVRAGQVKVLPAKTVEKRIVTDKTVERLEKLALAIEARTTAASTKLSALLKPVIDALNKEDDAISELVIAVKSMRDAASSVPALPRRSTAGFSPHVSTAAQTLSTASAVRVMSLPDWPGQPYDAGQTLASPEPANPDAREALSGPERKILDACAWWSSLNVQSPSMAQVAAVAGYTPTGGSFGTYLSRLSTQQLITRANGEICMTKAGWQVSVEPITPPTLAQLHERIRAILDGPGRKIIDVVIEAGGGAISTEDVGRASGYEPSGGSFGTYLSRLSGLGLIRRARGMIEPTEVLFPEGLT